MEIGIMGGTFDPIHKGHLNLASHALSQFSLDEIWFMPNGRPPHKDNTKITTTAADRVNMTRLAIEHTDKFCLNTYEAYREQTSYTFETLTYLKEKYPENRFYFIIGADSLCMIDQWVKPERIFPNCVILAACRDDMDTPGEMLERIAILQSEYTDIDIRILNAPLMDISSSYIRKQIAAGEDVSDYIPQKVEQYIRSHHLYESEN